MLKTCSVTTVLALVSLSSIAPAQVPQPAFVSTTDTDALSTTLQMQTTFAQLAERTYPSVVTVTAFVKDPSAARQTTEEGRAQWVRDFGMTEYPGYRRIGVASGFVVDEAGYIVTCRHALMTDSGEIADLVDVETEDRQHTISAVVGTEPTLNLAVLKLEVFKPGFPPKFRVAEFGDSDAVGTGTFVVACGDPFGPERFLGFGLIASLPARECYQELLSATYIQSTMRLHPQAYGGPLVDLEGKVIGISLPRAPNPGNLELQDSYGIEFALPSNILVGLYKSIREVKSFRSPWLGFAVTSRTELLRDLGPEAFKAMPKPRFGIQLENTFRPSPAATADLQPGDFLVKFDGQVVYTPIDFQRYLYLAGIGTEVELEIFRGGDVLTKRLQIEERPADAVTR